MKCKLGLSFLASSTALRRHHHTPPPAPTPLLCPTPPPLALCHNPITLTRSPSLHSRATHSIHPWLPRQHPQFTPSTSTLFPPLTPRPPPLPCPPLPPTAMAMIHTRLPQLHPRGTHTNHLSLPPSTATPFPSPPPLPSPPPDYPTYPLPAAPPPTAHDVTPALPTHLITHHLLPRLARLAGVSEDRTAEGRNGAFALGIVYRSYLN